MISACQIIFNFDEYLTVNLINRFLFWFTKCNIQFRSEISEKLEWWKLHSRNAKKRSPSEVIWVNMNSGKIKIFCSFSNPLIFLETYNFCLKSFKNRTQKWFLLTKVKIKTETGTFQWYFWRIRPTIHVRVALNKVLKFKNMAKLNIKVGRYKMNGLRLSKMPLFTYKIHLK